MKIQKYQTKQGNTRYKFQIYLGVSPTGKPVKTNRSGFKTLKEAKQEYQRIKKDYNSGKLELNSSNPYNINTLNDLYTYYLKRYKPTVKPQTYNQFIERYNRLFKDSIGKYKLKGITPIIAQEVVNRLAEKYKSYRNYVQILSPIFDYGVVLQVCDMNPFKLVTFPRKDPRTAHQPKTVLTKDELLEYLYACNTVSPFYYTYFSTLAFTGMRASEALALTWKDINLKKGTIKIDKTTIYDRNSNTTYVQDNTKTDIARIISIPKSLVNVLKKWKKLQPQNKYIFSKDNKLYSSIHVRSWIKSINKVLPQKLKDKKITSHVFRRTHSQLLLQSGVPMFYISKRLGHTNIDTTQDYYLSNTKELEKQALEKLDIYLHKVN